MVGVAIRLSKKGISPRLMVFKIVKTRRILFVQGAESDDAPLELSRLQASIWRRVLPEARWSR
jgi:hypothetical protein